MKKAKIIMTYDTAWAIATDRANEQMRKEKRSRWSEKDFDLAVKTLNELYHKEKLT